MPMKMCVKTACLFALFACVAAQVTTPAPPVHGAAAIDKVVNLLEDLKNKIVTDGEADQKVYDKYACWCETITSRKVADVHNLREETKRFGTGVLQYKGAVATLGGEVEQLGTDIKNNQKAQEEATTIRQKQNANYLTEKSESEAAVSAIEKAMKVLKTSADAGSFLQEHVGLLETVKAAVAAKATPRQLSVLSSAADQKKYTPQSNTVQGILSDMYATFVNDMQSASQREGSLQRGYETLMAAKQQELKTLQETMVSKDKEKGESELLMTDFTQSYSDTEAQLHSDTDFFDSTKAACTAKAAEWNERKKLREVEKGGIDEVVALLTSDTSREMFSRAIRYAEGSSFLQVESKNGGASKAYKTLIENAKKLHSTRLAAIAADLRIQSRYEPPQGHFDMVLSSVDKLIDELAIEQKSDDSAVDQCTMQYHEMAKSMKQKQFEIDTNTANIEKIGALIQEKEAEIEESQENLGASGGDLGQINATREAEHELYLHNKQDDETAIQILRNAQDVLMRYYEAQGVEFMQQEPAAPLGTVADIVALGNPDGTFATPMMRHNDARGAKGVLSLIIEDLQREIASATQGELAAAAAYKMQLESADDLTYDLNRKITNLNEMIATKGQEKITAEANKASNIQELEVEQATKEHLRPRCDFLIDGKDSRREKRNSELEALKQAKRFLKGATSAFLQRH